MTISWQYNDGGRKAAGFRGHTGDCVCRAIAIASGLPYTLVYNRLAEGNATQRRSKLNAGHRATGIRTASHGIMTHHKWFRDYMHELGFAWTPCMEIGSGCLVHLSAPELPSGHLVMALSRHYAAVINHVLHDTYDCSREGTRCVYGYWQFNAPLF